MGVGDLRRETRVFEKGQEIFRLMEEETPSLFNRSWWAARVLDMAMRNRDLKIQLFRFLDVFPSLTTTELVIRHIEEYFLKSGLPLPRLFRSFVAAAITPLAAPLTAAILHRDILIFGRMLIAGDTPDRALKTLKRIWESRRTFTVDLLGETAVSEVEADDYRDQYLSLLSRLTEEVGPWEGFDPEHERYFPRVNISVKLSSLYSRVGPLNYSDSVHRLKEKLRPLFRQARDVGAFVNLDMEMYSLKEITLDVFTELLDEEEFRAWDGAGIALQAYLLDTLDDIGRLREWARTRGTRVTVRLVKGAYWEYENVVASQKGWPLPVFASKAHSDWNFERCAEELLDAADSVTLAAGTHNVRSIASLMVMAEEREIDRRACEFQMLFGMAEPVKNALGRMGYAVREYAPVGQLLPGMAYLVRRLLENTSNEGFIRRRFVEGLDAISLLAPPEAPALQTDLPVVEPPGVFVNEPPVDLSRKENRAAWHEALQEARRGLGRNFPSVINGRESLSGGMIVSVNPARPTETVGAVSSVDRAMAEVALTAARKAQKEWGRVAPRERSGILRRAAELVRHRRFELMAWQVLEVGKNWSEADGDVTEAIDYLCYYAAEAERLGGSFSMEQCSGEENVYSYRPRGVALVLAPWNFPLAISMGMVSAALVTGNAVLYKPSSLSPVNGWHVFSILREAGVPDGVLNFIPGSGPEVGDFLVEHPETDLVLFTGSRDVGLRIVEKCGRVRGGQRGVKRAVAEMGGKNAILVDGDADLDLTVIGVKQSAFGYQGQKCSACSRVIVVESCYDRFLKRLRETVAEMPAGPPEDPSFLIGPVIDERAQRTIASYRDMARIEGRIVVEGTVPREGYYVPPVVVTDLAPTSRVLRDEIFGPVLSVIKARNMEEGLALANSSEYGLTGGLYSRNPSHVRRVREEFEVGNLYINRGITGAIVGRQPFGGFKMSGVGSKAGGFDYLVQFMEPRVVTENTMRRGFAPDIIA